MPNVLGRGQVLGASVLSLPKVGNKSNGRAPFFSAFRKG